MRSMPDAPSSALTLLTRMIGAGERHPLQVMAILHGHYGKLAALDGLDVRTEAEAAAAMGIKPGFPARKAIEQYAHARAHGGVQRAIDLLAHGRPRPARRGGCSTKRS